MDIEKLKELFGSLEGMTEAQQKTAWDLYESANKAKAEAEKANEYGDFQKSEAKKAFGERDAAKAKLREVEDQYAKTGGEFKTLYDQEKAKVEEMTGTLAELQTAKDELAKLKEAEASAVKTLISEKVKAQQITEAQASIIGKLPLEEQRAALDAFAVKPGIPPKTTTPPGKVDEEKTPEEKLETMYKKE